MKMKLIFDYLITKAFLLTFALKIKAKVNTTKIKLLQVKY